MEILTEMEIDNIYTESEIKEHGLAPNKLENFDFKVFQGSSKVYFFEPIGSNNYRLYSVISKKSFFL
jgi:hypothetical protein